MARTIYVDCVRRNPSHALRAVIQVVRQVRPGSTMLVVRSDSAQTVSLVREWARSRCVVGSVSGEVGDWEARLYLLPEQFAELPRCTRAERRESMVALGEERRRTAAQDNHASNAPQTAAHADGLVSSPA